MSKRRVIVRPVALDKSDPDYAVAAERLADLESGRSAARPFGEWLAEMERDPEFKAALDRAREELRNGEWKIEVAFDA